MRSQPTVFITALVMGAQLGQVRAAQPYTVVDTGQTNCYTSSGAIISPAPATNSIYYGQDAQFQDAPFSYRDNGDGTVSDLNTGLMWEKTTSTNRFTWADAVTYATTNRLGGYTDWRLAEIKELFSLASFYDGIATVFINTNYFTLWKPTDFGLSGEMGQTWANTQCACASAVTGNQGHWMFNFSDGHLKGNTKGPNWVRLVRGNVYGTNQFVNNGDGTVTDQATGLMWRQADAGLGMNWTNALVYAKGLRTGGYSDWRLPNLKELQSILDYTRGPDAVNPAWRSAAIDTNYFSCTLRADSLGYYWTSTSTAAGANAYYVAFGEALAVTGVDTHGAGAVRTDPKVGDPANWTNGLGPSPSDVVCITNYVRCVRKVLATDDSVGDGIPNAWRQQYFGGTGATTNASSCATCDSDHDGVDNAHEYAADTNPTNALSFFRIQNISQPGQAISFQSSSNRTYSLYARTNLAVGVWNGVSGQINRPGTGGVMMLTNPLAPVSQRFFRIGVQVP